MPQHANAQSFLPGDPRAIAAGRLGGKHRRARALRTPDYIVGYQAGARNARRHIRRWIQEQTMTPITAFIRIAQRLHADQLRATTPAERDHANEAFAHFLRMSGAGRLDEWIASHDTDYDDSLAANEETSHDAAG